MKASKKTIKTIFDLVKNLQNLMFNFREYKNILQIEIVNLSPKIKIQVEILNEESVRASDLGAIFGNFEDNRLYDSGNFRRQLIHILIKKSKMQYNRNTKEIFKIFDQSLILVEIPEFISNIIKLHYIKYDLKKHLQEF